MRKSNRAIWPVVLTILVLLLGACTVGPTPAVTTSVPDPTSTPETQAEPVEGEEVVPTPTATTPLAALVNGEPITLEEFERQMTRYEASMTASGQGTSEEELQSMLEEARVTVLDWMIEQHLMTQAAEKAGITISDEEVDASIESLINDIGQEEFDQRLADEGLTLEMMRAELKTQMIVSRMAEEVANAVPTEMEHVNARHIVVPTEEEARQILGQIQAGADFAALAEAYSQDAFTREQGGDLGYFPRGILTSPEVEDVAFSLQPGQVSDVVQSSIGYHIVQVVDRVDSMEVSPENLRLLKETAVRKWIDDLWAQAEIQRFIETESQ